MGKFIEKRKAKAMAFLKKTIEDEVKNRTFPACYSVLKKHCKEDLPSYETFLSEVYNEMGGLQ